MKGWIIGAGVATVAVGAGAATWATVSFLSAGPQAADVFPADSLALVSVDLDPGASQKIAAFKLANKIPSLKDELGLDSGDDLRRSIIDSLADAAQCDIDYDADVKPWIGSSLGFGIVGPEDPHPVLAMSVTDESGARKGMEQLLDCVESSGLHGDTKLGFAVANGWVAVASDKAEASLALASGAEKPLSEDKDYTRWTEAAGDAGIVTAYAAPGSFGPLLATLRDTAGDLGESLGTDLEGDLGSDLGGDFGGDLGSLAPSWCPGLGADTEDAPEVLADFGGAAATLRFDDSGLELEMASSAGERAENTHAADVTTLPDDVGAAIGIGFGKDFVDGLVTGLEQTCGSQFDPTALYAMVGAFTGLDLPEDLETLTQRSVQVALGPDLDVEAMLNSASPSEIPLALRIMGDPSTLEPVVDKLGALAPGSSFLEPTSGKESVTLGFSKEWSEAVAAGGDLGSNDLFTSVVPHAEEAKGVLYLHAGVLKDALVSLIGDPQVEEDLAPLAALGASTWVDGGTTHAQLALQVK